MKNSFLFLSVVFFIFSNATSQLVKVPHTTYHFDCSTNAEPVSKDKQMQKNPYVIITNKEELIKLTNCSQDYIFDFENTILIGINGYVSGCNSSFALFDVVKDTIQKKYIAQVMVAGGQGNCRGIFPYSNYIQIEKPTADYKVEFKRADSLDGSETMSTSYIMLRGYVSHSLTNEYLGAKITIQDLGAPEKIFYATSNSNYNGYYYLHIPRSRTYKISVTLDSLYYSEKLDLVSNAEIINDIKKGNKFIEKNIALHPLSKNEKIVLNNIYFESSKYELKPESYIELNNLIDLLKTYPHLKIEISGHTDNVGSPEFNLELSQKRAQAVADYITQEGIKPSVIAIKGYGSSQPVSDNNTEEGRAENRRIEFKIIEI